MCSLRCYFEKCGMRMTEHISVRRSRYLLISLVLYKLYIIFYEIPRSGILDSSLHIRTVVRIICACDQGCSSCN